MSTRFWWLRQRWRAAVHEAGHALEIMRRSDDVGLLRLTVSLRGFWLPGFATSGGSCRVQSTRLMTRSVYLAGAAAELAVFGNVHWAQCRDDLASSALDGNETAFREAVQASRPTDVETILFLARRLFRAGRLMLVDEFARPRSFWERIA